MIVEILSPSTGRRDMLTKLQLYEKTGVREYWIVDPKARIAQVHVLRDGLYDFEVYRDNEVVPVYVLDGCDIDLSKVFE